MKLIEITPESLCCVIGTCPAVFETDSGSYVLIGKVVKDGDSAALLAGRIGPDEVAIEIPKEFLSRLPNNQHLPPRDPDPSVKLRR